MKHLRKFLTFQRKLDSIACVALLCLLALILVSKIGITQNVDETLDACIFTETGEVLPCTVRLKGEVTLYLFREDQSSGTDEVIAYVGETPIAALPYLQGNEGYIWARDSLSTRILSRSRKILLVERDLQRIFPERESMRSILIAPAMEKADAAAFLEALDVDADYLAAFSWLTKN